MALLFERGVQGYSDSLDIFKPPIIDTSIYRKEYVSYQPVGVMSKGSPIQFDIPADSGDYKDLSKTALYVKVRIIKSRNVPVTAEDKVAFTNLALHSLFKVIELKMGNKPQPVNSEVGSHHSTKAYIDTLLDLNSSASELQGQMYIKETATQFNDTEISEGSNASVFERWEATKNGGAVELQGPLHLDFCEQDKLVLNNVRIRLK